MTAAASPAPPAPLASILLRERVLLLALLAAVVGLSWAYLAWMAADMAAASGATLAHCAAMPGMTSSSAAYQAWLLAMWAVMAVAMMLPTALPLLLLFLRLWRGRNPGARLGAPAAGLVAGYLAAWIGFGVVAAGLQYALEHAGVLTPVMGRLRSPVAAGATLLAAGVFQLTPLKTACLSRCRSPLGFLLTRWREGRLAPLRLGLDHGLFCLGCCWALMLVMFVAGVMNLAWMAALTAVMTAEKALWRGDVVARAAGVALLGGGAWFLLA